MAEYLITLNALSKSYFLNSGNEVRVLNSLSINVKPGEFIAIMGPSGSGKTTLMNILGTLDLPTSGEYALEGVNIKACSDVVLAHIRNATIGFVFQAFNLLHRRTIIDNIALPLVYSGVSTQERARCAGQALQQVGLISHRDHMPSQLSGGQQQRIAIARAFVNEPKLILADEPTGNLDSQTGKEIMELFCSLNRQGKTIILVTHEPDVALYSTRLIRLKDGNIIYDGLTSEAL